MIGTAGRGEAGHAAGASAEAEPSPSVLPAPQDREAGAERGRDTRGCFFCSGLGAECEEEGKGRKPGEAFWQPGAAGSRAEANPMGSHVKAEGLPGSWGQAGTCQGKGPRVWGAQGLLVFCLVKGDG